MAFFESEVITVGATVETLTVPDGFPTGAILGVEDNPIRITLDGTDPDNGTKHGIVLQAGHIFEVTGTRDLRNFKMIKADASDASVSVTYQQGS